MRLGRLFARIQSVGFEGPFYQGVSGKLRFLFETVGSRREFVFLGTRDSFASARPELPLELTIVGSFDGLEMLRSQLDAEYYPGFLDTWRKPFSWGEQVALGSVAGQLAAFAWVQHGNSEGFPTYYNRLFENDARILRVGVLPTFRRRGLNSRMMYTLLERLLAEGFVRVFAESHKYNVPSVRTFLKVGFRAVALLTVVSIPGTGELVRWGSLRDVETHLRDLDTKAR